VADAVPLNVRLALAIVLVACGHNEPTREPIANTMSPTVDAAPAPTPCEMFFEVAQRAGHCSQLDTRALEAIMQELVEVLGSEHTQDDCSRGLGKLVNLAGSAGSACSL
jgi:hypothetical protein